MPRNASLIGLTLAAVMLLGFVGGFAQEAAPIRIMALTSLSGPFAPWGINVRDGMQLAAEEVNAAGGVLGRKVAIVERDTRNSPDEAMTHLRAGVEREGIVAAGGIISSGVGLAASRVAEELNVPLFLTMSGSHKILRKDSRYTFRTCLVAATMTTGPFAAFIQEKGISRAGAIVADYAWGHAVQEAIERHIASLPGVEVRIEVAPVPEKNFTTYLRRLQRLDPELLILLGHPPGAPAAAKQALELGIGQFISGAIYPTEVWVERGGRPIFGRVVEYSCADYEDAAYQQLAAKFHAKVGRFFDFNAFSGYAIVKLMADAVQRTGTTDPKALAAAVRTGRFVQPGYAFPLSYTEWGELKEATPILYTFEAGDPGAINPGADWRPRVLFRSPPLAPYVPEE
ncbi:MAG: ABC transporter substrate-binding protein [Candidatus Tectimicrobiota bacterium]|nr:MAG: ABC transporter substrate-binding protein [Candidatus Tectomicrobia bacterium]